MAPLLESRLLQLHCTYFFLMSMIGSVILYTSSTQINHLQYVDALFMSFSAMTGTGLSVLDLSTLNALQQVTLFMLLIMGHAIPVHAAISFLRALTLRFALKDKNKIGWQTIIRKPVLHTQENVADESYDIFISAKLSSPLKSHITERRIYADIPSPDESNVSRDARHFIIITNPSYADTSQEYQCIEGFSHPGSARDLKTCLFWISMKLKSIWPRIKNHQSLSRSIDPSEPGWIEYNAMILVSLLAILYTVSFLFIGILSVGLWLKLARPDIPLTDGVSPLWAGAFLATSAFVNNGMSLIDANMTPFQLEPTPLLICGFLILAGNTLFPCLLRLVIWAMRKALPERRKWRLWQQTLDLILTQPQSVCTFLYPAWHTWFLFGTVLMLNGIMLGAFELASLRNSEIASLPFKFRVLDGLFQSSAVRGGGFSVVTFETLPQGLLIVYVLMMYLPLFPASAVLSTYPQRKTPKSIPCLEAGELACSIPVSGSESSILSRRHVYYEHFRVQLSYDLWWLSLAIIVICVVESNHYTSQPLAFSTFNIIFEVVSAYSYVGVSVGYPGKNYSFCGEWSSFSKVLLILISFIGRHRDLPISNWKSTWSSGSKEASEKDIKLQDTKVENLSFATDRLY